MYPRHACHTAFTKGLGRRTLHYMERDYIRLHHTADRLQRLLPINKWILFGGSYASVLSFCAAELQPVSPSLTGLWNSPAGQIGVASTVLTSVSIGFQVIGSHKQRACRDQLDTAYKNIIAEDRGLDALQGRWPVEE